MIPNTSYQVPIGTRPLIGEVSRTRRSGKLVTVLEVIDHVSKSGKVTYRTRCEDEAGLEVWTSF